MAPPKQSSLDSFFGAKGTSTTSNKNKNGGGQQKRIESFFGTTSAASKDKKEKKVSADKVQKENSNSSGETSETTPSSSSVVAKKTDSPASMKNEDDDASSNSEEVVSSTTAAAKNKKRKTPDSSKDGSKKKNKNRRRRAIVDDSSDDDDEDEKEEELEVSNSTSASKEEAQDDDDDDQNNVTTAKEEENGEDMAVDKKITTSAEEDDDDATMKKDEKGMGKESSSPSPPTKKKKKKKTNNKKSDSSEERDVAAEDNKKESSSTSASKQQKPPRKNSGDSNKSNTKTENNDSCADKLSSKKSSPPDNTAADSVSRPVSSLVKLGKFKTDETLLTEIATADWENWDDDDSMMMPYAVLCQTFEKIEPITSRLAIQEIMTTLFRQIMLKKTKTTNNNNHNYRDDMATVLYLASNTVAAAYECVELGIGDSLLIKAIGEAYGTNPKIVKEKYETIGDLGSVAQSCKSKQKSLGSFFASVSTTTKKSGSSSKKKNFLTATEVLDTFRQIAKTKGNQSQKWKVDKIKKLLVKVTIPAETRYIIRGLQGKLRIGLAQSTVLISLAHALSLTIPATIDKELQKKKKPDDDYPEQAKQYMSKDQPVEKRLEGAVSIVRKAYSEVPSYEAILDAALKVPLFELHKACTLTPGVPVVPMLAKPTKSVQEVLKRLNGLKFTCEFKYDGERAQVHMLSDGTTKVFSRNLLDTSEKYPEVPAFVKEACTDVDSFVLDAEVVAFNRETGQLVPFQVLSTRKKTEESAETAKVQVIVQAFDLMYLNGKSLLSRTLAERRALLQKHFLPVDGKFQFAKSLDLEENGDTTKIEEFLDSAVKGQCEGLMVKTLDVNAIYEPSRRSLNWLKLKKDYLEGLGDSVDLVPLGAYHGRGKRTGVYGAYLLACYDPDTEEFQSVCKIGTGFSDEDLKTLSDSLNKHKIPIKSSQYNVSDQLECDVWFDATHVWEVKAADLSKSSLHRGADGKTGEAGRGIGLRFPRFERLRDDKRPEEATTSDQILDMYYQQDAIVGDKDDADDDNDDGGI